MIRSGGKVLFTRGCFVRDNYMRYPERRGDPAGRPYGGKGLFTGCARGFLRNYEGQFLKWEKGAGIRELKGISSQIHGIFKELCGTFSGFGAIGKELFWKTNPQKRPFFSFNRWFWDCFFEVSEVCEVPEEPEGPEEPKEPKGQKSQR